MKLPVAIVVGDPSGVGPDVLVRLLSHAQFNFPLVIISDIEWWKQSFI